MENHSDHLYQYYTEDKVREFLERTRRDIDEFITQGGLISEDPLLLLLLPRFIQKKGVYERWKNIPAEEIAREARIITKVAVELSITDCPNEELGSRLETFFLKIKKRHFWEIFDILCSAGYLHDVAMRILGFEARSRNKKIS